MESIDEKKLLELFECEKCGAVVSHVDRHLNWHRRLNQSFQNLAEATIHL